MAEINEVAITSANKLKLPIVNVLFKSSYYEKLRMKIVESTIVSGILLECYPRVDTPRNP